MIHCGDGTKGRSAVSSPLGGGTERSKVVVAGTDERALERAEAEDLAAVGGDGARTDALRAAGIDATVSVIQGRKLIRSRGISGSRRLPWLSSSRR